ncbi:hypothetical protein RFI_15888 [Reticulomyxa filosa]|uniref:Uncharacterized protein n=1 Tax=Reticulomyxa filosa TaxID=46433 RepID=X6N5N0_RETFI|nr:hypothetical protein RFI_15888 [Reticulomyxa filosa]|eukprot:ETO21316.1 hypothetical protein RFI_15888 [Reticulomyxa filosa]
MATPKKQARRLSKLINRYKSDGIEEIPFFKENNINIIQITSGCKFNLVLDNKFQIWAFGEYYCCPHTKQDIFTPQITFVFPHPPLNFHNLKISCGDFHTTLLVNQNTLYGFGNNSYQQLCFGECIPNTKPPEQQLPPKIQNRKESILVVQKNIRSIVHFNNVVDIFAGSNCTFILTRSPH